jgi:hypothetical protein
MKFLIKIFKIFVLFSAGVTAQSADNNCFGILEISTDNENSIIVIDGEVKGYGQAKINLPPGEHKIFVGEAKRNWNAAANQETIEILCDQKIEKEYSFNDELYIQTFPQDAYVYKNDTLIGHTPLFLSAKLNEITLRKPGYVEKNIFLKKDLNKIPITLEFTGLEREEIFYKKNIFKILIGSLIVLGGTTAYYKLLADDKFEEYQFTGEAALLNQTRKYDLISGISFGLTQINFGILIYYFLIN